MSGIASGIRNGWLVAARHCPSPNSNERPNGTVIDLIVVHGISLPPEQFGGHFIEHFFCNRLDPEAHPYFRTIANVQVSAHLLIRREGEIVQFVDFGRRAWHAGQSSWQGRENCNDYSIGIELEGCDTLPYTTCQYERLASVIQQLRLAYAAIAAHAVVGHSDIAPGRKTDPGPCFEWPLLQQCRVACGELIE